MSPTQRTLQFFRRAGYRCAITEHWNGHAGIRQDLFGFVDVLAIRGLWTVGIQACAGKSMSARQAKIEGLEAARDWLADHHRRIVVVGWRKTGPRGKVKKWAPRIMEAEIVEGAFVWNEMDARNPTQGPSDA